jgi:hypothetical protein
LKNVPIGKEEYSVNNLGNFEGGNITFHSTPEEEKTLTIIGYTSRQRAVDYSPYIVPTSDAMNLDSDYQEAQIQENSQQLKHAMMVLIKDGIDSQLVLPNREDRKDSYLGFDGYGNPIALGDSANLVKGIGDEGSTPDAMMI